MTEPEQSPGGNSRAQIVAFAQRMQRLLDDKAAIDEDIKALKGEMKIEAFGKDEMKAFAQCVKELRRGPDYQSGQLQLELILDTYRGALDLPRDLEVAQTRARAALDALGDSPHASLAPSADADDSFGDGEPAIPARKSGRARRGGLN
jgi:uncharacterized protein (UPF0335 family)